MAYIDKIQLPSGTNYDLQGIEYIQGTHTAATPSWEGITKSAELYKGKTIAYKLPFTGVSGTSASLNLGLNGSTTTKTGAKTIYLNNNTGVTTHYPANSVIILTYDGTNWRISDYGSDYSAMSTAEGVASTATSSRTMRADYLDTIVRAKTFSTAKNGVVPKPTAAQSTAKYHLAANGTWVADSDTQGSLSGTTGTDNYKVVLSKTASTATISAASTAQAGVMTTAQVSKLNGIETGANKFTHPTHTAATVGPTANATLAHGGTVSVPQVTVNSSGHVSALTARTITLPGDNNSTYGLSQDSSDGHKLIWKGSGVTQTTFTIPDNNTTYGTFTTAANGLTPKPTAAQSTSSYFLKANGTWAAANNYTHPTAAAAATLGPTANASPAHGSTFTVPYFTTNASGHITGTANRTITLPADNNTTYDTMSTAEGAAGTATTTRVITAANLKSIVENIIQTSSSSTFTQSHHGTVLAPGQAGWKIKNSYYGSQSQSFLVVSADDTGGDGYYPSWRPTLQFAKKTSNQGTIVLSNNNVTTISLNQTNILIGNEIEIESGDAGICLETSGYYLLFGSLYVNPASTAGLVGCYLKVDNTEIGGHYEAVGNSLTARAVTCGPFLYNASTQHGYLYLAGRGNNATITRNHASTYLCAIKIGNHVELSL